jgi:hypothetical protein
MGKKPKRKRLRIRLPKFVLMVRRDSAFVLPSEPQIIWPLFDTKDAAAKMAIGTGRPRLVIAEIITAKYLLQHMKNCCPTGVTHVWLEESISAKGEMQFRKRVSAVDFAQSLEDQSQEEGKANQN